MKMDVHSLHQLYNRANLLTVLHDSFIFSSRLWERQGALSPKCPNQTTLLISAYIGYAQSGMTIFLKKKTAILRN